MTKIESSISHIASDMSEIKRALLDQDKRVDELEKLKYRIQGMGYALSAGLAVLFVEVFIKI